MHDKIRIDLETGLMLDVVSPYETGEDIIETPCPDGFHLPRWDGERWAEGGTAPESVPPTPQEPTIGERVRANEDAILALMGVLYNV